MLWHKWGVALLKSWGLNGARFHGTQGPTVHRRQSFSSGHFDDVSPIEQGGVPKKKLRDQGSGISPTGKVFMVFTFLSLKTMVWYPDLKTMDRP